MIYQNGASGFWDDKATEEDCGRDAGSLGFVLCPILTTTRTAVEKLIGSDGSGNGFLVDLLTIKPLEKDSELYQGWAAIRDVALGLYVLIFIAIVFGNGLGYDPYTVKRALPRLATGVLLTWASFYIMQTLVDLSNLVGSAIPSFLSAITDNNNISTYNLDLDFAAGALTIILAIVLAFAALGALLIGLAGLITRIIVIYGLVLLAPVAFVAWVLPNTESLFKKWWKNLIKVLMMFPIVTGMLAIALFFQSVSTSADSPNILKIAGSLAPLIAIILIPKTFKWGGEAFAAAAGYMAGKAQGTGDKIKGIPGAAGRKAAGSAKERALSSDTAAAMTGALASNKLGRLMGGKGAMRASGRARGRVVGEAESLTKNMTDDQLEKTAKVGTHEERVAAIGQLAKRRNRKKLAALASEGGRTARAYDDASGRHAGDWGKHADLRRIGGKYTNTSDMSIQDSADLHQDAFATGLATGSISYASAKAIYENDRTRASLSPQKLHDLTTYLNRAGYEDAKTSSTVEVQGKDSRGDKDTIIGTRTSADGKGQKIVFKNKQSLQKQLGSTATQAKGQYDNHMNNVVDAAGNRVPMNIDPQNVHIDPSVNMEPPETPPVAPKTPQQRWQQRGQGGYIDPSRGTRPGPTGGSSPGGSPAGGSGSPRPGGGPSGGPVPHIPTSPPPPPTGGAPTYSTPAGAPRYTTGGVPIPPPPSSSTPSWSTTPPSSSSTPPPFRGTLPPSSSAPPAPTPGGGGALPPTPSSGGSGSGGATVINNVTNEVSNNVTNNVSTSRNANQASPVGSIGGPTTIPSGALGDLSRQIGRMMARTGSSAGLASLESKISTLQDMITREGRNSNNVKNLMRTMREEARSLPSHEQGATEDALNNFEHQSGINGPDSSGGTESGDI
jgi:hypothetical protein